MIKYTPQQNAVVNNRGKNMIVSASAGTGKTTVMVDRIIQMVLAGQLDLDNLLAITFTKLAAGEMKNKLSSKLQAIKTDKAREQCEKIDSCAISTIHSFCADVVRNFFYLVDVDPNFVIVEGATERLLRAESLQKTIVAFQNDAVFSQLYSLFLKGRKEKPFNEAVRLLYDFSRAQVNFEKWWQEKRQNYQNVTSQSTLCKLLNDNLKIKAIQYQQGFVALADAYARLGLDRCKEKAKQNAIELDFYEDTLKESVQNLDRKFVTLGRPNKQEKEAEQDYINLKANFDDLVKQSRDLLEQYQEVFSDGFLTATKRVEESLQFADKMVEFVLQFNQNYFELKKQRGFLDFSDLEKLTLAIIQDADALTQLQEKYTYVFVDEYQDVNGVQEAMIEKLKGHCNLFMVGDEKQSIYDFRQCDPKYFSQKCEKYQTEAESELIRLNTNFRSTQDVLSFVNDVFGEIMTKELGGVDYEQTAKLSSNITQTANNPAVFVDFVYYPTAEKEEAKVLYDITQDVTPLQTKGRRQGEVICQRIQQLVGSVVKTDKGQKRLSYGDVVLLFRSINSPEAMDIYNCLVENNIPVSASFKQNEFELKELKDLVNLLRVVDNPFDDVATAGVCLSYFGGFDEDELSKVVLAGEKELSLFEKLQQSPSSKAKAVVDLVQKSRLLSATKTMESVLLAIIEQTNYHLYVQGLPNGHIRIKKLYSFLDQIKGKEYAQSVNRFLAFVDLSAEERENATVIAPSGAVRMMTMHASKGLEFPVVFVCNANKEFRFDNENTYLLNKDLGLAFNSFDFAQKTIKKTMSTFALTQQMQVSKREEEMRLLYVALTRAQNHLIVVCDGDELHKANQSLPSLAKRHADWIGYALTKKYGDLQNDKLISGRIAIKHWHFQTNVVVQSPSLLCAQTGDFDKTLADMQYVYPYAQSKELPMKVVSSRLDKMYSNDENLPLYNVSTTQNEDSATVGSDYHKVFELVNIFDVENLASNVAELEKKNLITSKLDLDVITKVAQNKELQTLLARGKVYREQPFMLKVSAKEVIANCSLSDDVILQGIIDVVIIRGDNTAVVLDYKYTRHPEFIKKNYSTQLQSYAMAVQSILKVSKVEKYVMSIADNQLIKM